MTETMQEHFGWIEIVLVAVVAFGFGFYQLWSVNREIRRDKEARERDSASPGHPVGEHELDDR
jgi:hypothetical protein